MKKEMKKGISMILSLAMILTMSGEKSKGCNKDSSEDAVYNV